MSLTIHLPSVLAPLAGGTRTLAATGATLGAAIADLTRKHPNLSPRLVDPVGAPYPFVTFYLNDEDIRLLEGFETPVHDGDELTIVPAVAGG
jgi:sulfur-carrier protein